MSDEDINPIFPELEGSWVRKESYDTLRKQLAEEKSAREAMEYLLSEWQNASNLDYDTLRKQLDIAMEALNNIYTHENNFTKATLIRIAVTALAEINRNK
jgi:uncharacterized protein YukE